VKNLWVLLFLFLLTSSQAEAKKMFPLPIRLNNPGALEINETRWKGMTNLQTDKRFVRFINPRYGIRALMKVLRTYENKYGLNTVNVMIHRWAPPSENDTQAYINFVAKRVKIPQNQILDLDDREVLIALAKAIVLYESGFPPADMPPNWYHDEEFEVAADMVLGKE
jgi:hypothetical protein